MPGFPCIVISIPSDFSGGGEVYHFSRSLFFASSLPLGISMMPSTFPSERHFLSTHTANGDNIMEGQRRIEANPCFACTSHIVLGVRMRVVSQTQYGSY